MVKQRSSDLSEVPTISFSGHSQRIATISRSLWTVNSRLQAWYAAFSRKVQSYCFLKTKNMATKMKFQVKWSEPKKFQEGNFKINADGVYLVGYRDEQTGKRHIV